MIVIYRSAYDDEDKVKQIDNIQSIIYNAGTGMFMVNGGKKEEFFCFPREELRHIAIYDHWPEIPEGGKDGAAAE